MSVDSYVRAAPKAELHVHLEGAIQPATLLALARRNGVALPADTVDGLRRWFAFRDFPHFIQVYIAVSRCLKRAEDYELVTYELGAELARQHVCYAEVTFSPSTHRYTLGNAWDEVFDGLTRGRQRADRELGVELRWIFDVVGRRPASEADFVTQVAIDGREEGVVALGAVGVENDQPAAWFAPWFERASAAGLRSAPHAGEVSGPESIWAALDVLGADRIGHGVRSVEDPSLVQTLAKRGVPLEVCPTSNVRLGIVTGLAQHPLKRLLAAGVAVSIGSDDPALFGTSLSDEIALLPAAFGLPLEAVDELLLNGVRQSFLPPAHKSSLEVAFRQELTALRRAHLAGA